MQALRFMEEIMGLKGLFGDGSRYGTEETADWNRAGRAEYSIEGKQGFGGVLLCQH